jgi:hypothetical protein
VLGWEHDQGLQRLRVPDVYQRVDVDLTCGSDSEEGMLGNGRYFELMPLIESLLPPIGIVDYSNTRRVVQNVLLARCMDAIIFDRLLLLQQVLVVCPQNAREDVVQLPLRNVPEIKSLLRREVLRVLLPVGGVLIDFIEEVDVHERIPLVGDEHSVDVLQMQSDGRRPPPDFLLVVKIILAQDPIDSGVVGAPDEDRLVLDLVRLPLDYLEAVIQLQDQSLVLQWIQHDPLQALLDGGGLCRVVGRRQWFAVKGLEFELAHCLVLVAKGEHSLVVNRHFDFLNVRGVRR